MGIIKVETEEAIKEFEQPIFLDLGCGRNKFRADYVGVDISSDVGADLIFDIGSDVFPFPDESIDFIRSSHTFEHLNRNQIIWAMNECFRVLKWSKDSHRYHGGSLNILVPHKDCELAWQDPMHKTFFVQSFFKFFCGDYLIKHKLDYPISACFLEEQNYLVPEEDPHYCTMIDVILEKNFYHYMKKIKHFPFNKKHNDKIEEEKEFTFEDIVGENFDKIDSHLHNKEFYFELKRVAKKMVEEHFQDIMDIKLDATKRYGANPAPGGLDGLYQDLLRKFTRVHNYFKKGETMTKENIIDTLYDNAIYSILAVMEIKEKGGL